MRPIAAMILRPPKPNTRRAIADHPEAADAWNNLAHVLHEQKRDPAALEAAERVVALDGPRKAIYESTLAAIRGNSAQ